MPGLQPRSAFPRDRAPLSIFSHQLSLWPMTETQLRDAKNLPDLCQVSILNLCNSVIMILEILASSCLNSFILLINQYILVVFVAKSHLVTFSIDKLSYTPFDKIFWSSFPPSRLLMILTSASGTLPKITQIIGNATLFPLIRNSSTPFKYLLSLYRTPLCLIPAPVSSNRCSLVYLCASFIWPHSA